MSVKTMLKICIVLLCIIFGAVGLAIYIPLETARMVSDPSTSFMERIGWDIMMGLLAICLLVGFVIPLARKFTEKSEHDDEYDK